LPLKQRLKLIAEMDQTWLNTINDDFGLFAHAHQFVDDVTVDGRPWSTWLIVGGRGSGKTRAGAEWVKRLAGGTTPLTGAQVQRIALIGQTEHDVREVMIEGVSGLLSVHDPDLRPTWIASRRRLEWKNGAVAEAFSAEEPESLRGPHFGGAWCDEL
jgi:phage terminase large subunit-like protein